MTISSAKAWWLSIGAPVVAFLWASFIGCMIVAVLVIACAECRRRYAQGKRGREIIFLHKRAGGDRA